MRSGDWKLIHFYDGDRVELYNLKDDVSESHDLATERPDVVKRLRAKLNAWLDEMGALNPTVNADWPTNQAGANES